MDRWQNPGSELTPPAGIRPIPLIRHSVFLHQALDEETGKLTARHFFSASYGPGKKAREVTVHCDVPPSDDESKSLATTLGGVIKSNRGLLEKDARKARSGGGAGGGDARRAIKQGRAVKQGRELL